MNTPNGPSSAELERLNYMTLLLKEERELLKEEKKLLL